MLLRCGKTRPRCTIAAAIVALESASPTSNARVVPPTTVEMMLTPATAWISAKGSDAGTPTGTAVSSTVTSGIAARANAAASFTAASPGCSSTGVMAASRGGPSSGCTRKTTGSPPARCGATSA
jgi:hypothetical protein